jgi:hypothetical protein
MNRRMLILAAAFLSAMRIKVYAQQIGPVGVKELKAVLEDDARFTQLLTEVWVLRDLLALQLGGNISAETKEFQALQDRLRDQRASLLESLSAEQPNVQFPQEVLSAADRFAVSLEQFGVKRESELGKRLVAASMLFGQALVVALLGSLCDVHPFRAICSQG